MSKAKALCAGVAAAAAVSALVAFGAGEGASQKWVKMYVESYVSNAIANSVASLVTTATTTHTNGVTTVSVGEGKNRMWVSYEDASVYALVATNATDAAAEFGITNGFLFVWNGDGTYVNGNGETVVTYTNRSCLTWHEVDSAVTNGFETFAGNFAVLRTMLQPSVALVVTNSLRTASARSSESRPSLFSLLGSLFVGSAFAKVPGGWLKSAEDWYAPTENYEVPVMGEIARYDKNGDMQTEEVDIASIENETTDYFSDSPTVELSLAFSALKLALNADRKAQLADAEVKAVAANLATLDWTTLDAEVKDTASGATASGNIEKIVEKVIDRETKVVIKAPGILGAAQVDNQTIVTNKSGKLALREVPDKIFMKGYQMPYFSQNAKLEWDNTVNLVDRKSLEWWTTDGEEIWSGWRIKGWYDDASCKEKLSEMLTDPKHAEQRGKHEILCRYGGNKGKGEIHYLPLGGLISMPEADGATISTNETGQVGKFAVKGAYESGNADKALFSTGAGVEWRDASGGGAFKFVGTDGGEGVTVGSGATTNVVAFAHPSDSNVKVTCERTNDGVKITIGVYYQ